MTASSLKAAYCTDGTKCGITALILCHSILLAGTATMLGSCEKRTMETIPQGPLLKLSDAQASQLARKRIYFGHQSVGNNIIQGIRELVARDSRLKLNIVRSSAPETILAPAFVESEIGQNGDPQSKDRAFRAVLDRGMGSQGGIAMYKYCYVDINATTDVPAMFASYRKSIDEIEAMYPSLKVVHITVPLTTVQTGIKAWLKQLLGRGASEDVAAKRHEFNSLLKSTFAGKTPVFDLAEAESTHVDGSRSYLMRGSARVYILAPEFTDDGGHLNATGRQVVAERLLAFLAEL